MAQLGSASALGAEGRRFESGYPDREIKRAAGPADPDPVTTPTTEPIAMSWQPERADYREVVLLCARTRRRAVLGTASGIGLLLLLGGVLARSGFSAGVGIGLIAYCALLTAYVHLRGGSGFWKHAFLRSPKTAELSAETGLGMTSPEATTTYAWSAFATCQETDRLLVLRLVRSGRRLGAFLVLPKRGFADPADVDRARELFRATVPGGVNRV